MLLKPLGVSADSFPEGIIAAEGDNLGRRHLRRSIAPETLRGQGFTLRGY